MQQAQALKDQANTLFKEKQYNKAIEVYHSAIQQFGNKEKNIADLDQEECLLLCVLFGNIAACYYQTKDWKLCEKFTRESLHYDNFFVKSIYRLAQCLQQQFQKDPKKNANLQKEAKLVLLDIIYKEKSKDTSGILSCVKLYRQLEKNHVGK